MPSRPPGSKLRPGEQAPDFSLPGVNLSELDLPGDGQSLRLADALPTARATVVMFICNHCPYVKAYVPRLIELQRRFAAPAGDGKAPAARFIGICSNDASEYPQDGFEPMKAAARDWGLNFPYLRDEDQAVARVYGAERTPEIFVLDPGGVCRYEGGIDDCYQDPARVTRHPLRDAVEAVAAGKEVKEPQTWAIGCTIKWKKA